ncbi:hypothetical protein D3C84_845860 [compost metagenome]
MVDARAKLATQPGVKKYPFHLRAELPLPALFKFRQQGQEQLLAQGAWRVERHGLVDGVVQGPFAQLRDGVQQGMAQHLPIVFNEPAEGLRGVEQLLDLADGHAAVDPGEYRQNALYMFSREQPVPLGCALRHDQAIATFPGSQRHGVHPGLPGDFADRQPAFVQGLLEVGTEVFAGAAVE